MGDFFNALLDASMFHQYSPFWASVFSLSVVLGFDAILQELKIPRWIAPPTFIPIFAMAALVAIMGTVHLRNREALK